jgi:UrcA family protein
MTRPNSALVLRRASERLSAGAAALALTFLTLLTVDVRAAVPEPVPAKVIVHYSETAFGTAEGTAQVYRKLKSAARMVCGINDGGRLTIDQGVAAKNCFDTALADAVRRIDRPMLTSVHTRHARNLG